MQRSRIKASLILADGTVFHGYSFGAKGTRMGEMVFTTGVVGFQETLTDPSNLGQIVVQTFPSVGGYGVNEDDYASHGCHLSGYVVREWTDRPSNYKMVQDIASFMEENGVVGIYGVDTRALTRRLRDGGSINAMLSTEILESSPEVLEQIRAYAVAEDAVAQVACTEPQEYPVAAAQYHVTMVDYGCRLASIHWLQKNGCSVTLVPPTTSAQEILAAKPDGVILSDGPGDPHHCGAYLDTVSALMQSGTPLLGLGLGHQLMALASSFAVEKLSHGHRGSNHPVLDMKSGHVFVTAQNHGYTVKKESILRSSALVSQINLSDLTCEALCYEGKPAMSVQYMPESIAGDRDAGSVFRSFAALMNK